MCVKRELEIKYLKLKKNVFNVLVILNRLKIIKKIKKRRFI